MTEDEDVGPGGWASLGADPSWCADCVHAKLNVTRRGTAYLRCLRATFDHRFPRYPRLPVVECPGFEPADAPDEG